MAITSFGIGVLLNVGVSGAGLLFNTVTGIITSVITSVVESIVSSIIDFGLDTITSGVGYLGGQALGIVEDMQKLLGGMLDTVTLDATDFDQSGGNLFLHGAGEAIGLQGSDVVGSDKPITNGQLPAKVELESRPNPGAIYIGGVPTGAIIRVVLKNGDVRRYRLETYTVKDQMRGQRRRR